MSKQKRCYADWANQEDDFYSLNSEDKNYKCMHWAFIPRLTSHLHAYIIDMEGRCGVDRVWVWLWDGLLIETIKKGQINIHNLVQEQNNFLIRYARSAKLFFFPINFLSYKQ